MQDCEMIRIEFTSDIAMNVKNLMDNHLTIPDIIGTSKKCGFTTLPGYLMGLKKQRIQDIGDQNEKIKNTGQDIR